MRRFSHIALLLCILLHLGAQAQVGEKSILGLTAEGDTTLHLTFEAGSFAIVADGGHATLVVDGLVQRAAAEGLAALPRMSRLVVLPRGSMLQLKDYRCGETLRLPIDGEPLPWQGATLKETERPWVPLVKETAAESGALKVEDLGVMGDRQVFRVTVCPAQYNPADNSYSLTKSIDATFTAKPSTLNTKHSTLNTTPTLLIVSRPEFREGLQEFVQWKRQEGYMVEELYADTNKRDSVKALIRPYFDNATPLRPAPDYILIVGDAAKIQAFIGTSHPSALGNHSTDLYYAEYTGDWLPDACIGRWPVNDTAELGAVVRKTLRYEQCRDIDTAALRRAILVAGSESRTPAPTTTNGQVNYVSRRLKERLPEVDTLCYHNPASGSQGSAILGAIGSGAGLLNYTAHCTVGGWASPSVTFTSIDTLDSQQPMVYVNNCCRSNDFSGTCFGEQLLRKAGGGAIGVIGATNETLWEEDYYWAVGGSYPLSLTPQHDSLRPGAFDRLLDSSALTLGKLLQAGNMAVTASGSIYERFYWEIYCLLGDPTLMPHIGPQRELYLWTHDSIELGATQLHISSSPGATIAVTQGSRLISTIYYGNYRSITLRFNPISDTLPLVVTASGPQMIPATDTVYVSQPQGRAAMLHGIATADSTLGFSLTNTGTDTLYDLTLFMMSDSGGATFNTDTLRIDTLAPQATESLTMTVALTRWERWWGGTVAAVDSRTGDTLCRATVSHWMADMLPTLTFTVATPAGGRISTIEPNSSYTLTATASGPYDSIGIVVTALPTSDTILLTPDTQLLTPDTVTHLHIEATVRRGNYERHYSYYLEAGSRTPRSAAVLSCYPWRHEGALPWAVDETTMRLNGACLRSGAISDKQQSDLWLDVLLPQADSIVFWARTSSEAEYDWFTFEVDGTKKCQQWGDYAWRRYAFLLSAGSHTLRWHYRKDDSDHAGSDCVWIDALRLPLALWEEPYGCADEETHGIAAPDAQGAVLLYPNPADATITLDVDGPVAAELTDLYGRRVALWHHNATGPATFDIRNIPSGVYLLLFHSGTGVEHHKLIIQH